MSLFIPSSIRSAILTVVAIVACQSCTFIADTTVAAVKIPVKVAGAIVNEAVKVTGTVAKQVVSTGSDVAVHTMDEAVDVAKDQVKDKAGELVEEVTGVPSEAVDATITIIDLLD